MIFLSVFSTCVFASSLASIGWAIAVTSGQIRKTVTASNSYETWRFALGFTSVLLLAIAANAWIAADIIHRLVLAAGAISVLTVLGFNSPGHRRAFLAVVCGATVCAGTSAAFWNWLFYGNDYWLASGTNHDLLYFFIGSQWVEQHSVLASQELIQSELHLGACQAALVGSGCPVYRGGSYTWIALVNGLGHPFTPTNARSAVSLVALCAFVGLVPSVVRTLSLPLAGIIRRVAVAVIGATLISVSTGVLSAVFNENVGTALVAAPLVMIVCFSCVRDAHRASKAVLLGVCAGLAGHLYGEGLVYACLMVAAGVVSDSIRLHKPRWILIGGALAGLTVIISLNVVLAELAHSFEAIRSTVSAGGSWGGWYLDHSYSTWFAAPFAGVLMSAGEPVSGYAVLVGAALTATTIFVGIKNGDRVVLLGLIALNGALVVYLTQTGYAYGEHKVVQLLAPMWSAYLVVSLLARAEPSRTSYVLAVAAGLLVASLAGEFIKRADPLVASNLVGVSLRSDFDDGFAFVKRGDEIAVDTQLATEGQRIYRLDYAAAIASARGARLRLPAYVEPRSVGHTQRALANTLATAATPDWLMQLKGARASTVLDHSGYPTVFDGSAYRLYRLSRSSAPIALLGKGVQQCSATSCSISSPLEIEIFSPAACVRPTLVITLDDLAAPQLSVEGANNSSAVWGRNGRRAELQLPPGWSVVRLRGGERAAKRPEVVAISTGCSTTCARAGSDRPVGGTSCEYGDQ